MCEKLWDDGHTIVNSEFPKHPERRTQQPRLVKVLHQLPFLLHKYQPPPRDEAHFPRVSTLWMRADEDLVSKCKYLGFRFLDNSWIWMREASRKVAKLCFP